MLTDRLAELIARSLSREASLEELDELEAHMRIHPEGQYFRDILISYWNSHQNMSQEDDSSSDQHFKYILALADAAASPDTGEMESLPRQNWKVWIRRLSMAAVVAGIILITILLIPRRQSPSLPEVPLQNEEIAKKGARTKLLLPDGSQVWLNSETKFIYPEKFADHLREVNLDGEAYFDVVKDSSKPFIVHTSGIDIHVLGTIFNVKSYADEPTIETTLIKGKIEIVQTKRPGAPRQLLSPHQKAIYLKTAEIIKEQSPKPSINNNPQNAAMRVWTLPKYIADSSIRETFWVYNKLVFDSGKFRQIAARLERWYNVEITFKDQSLADFDFHATFLKDEPVEQALEELKLIAPFVYKKTGDQIEIDKKK